MTEPTPELPSDRLGRAISDFVDAIDQRIDRRIVEALIAVSERGSQR